MFNAGQARMFVDIQNPVEVLDTLFAPTRSWVSYMAVNAAIENEEFSTDDSMNTGPREEGVKSMTLVIRNHPLLVFSTTQRVVDMVTRELYEITAIRYDGKRTKCFIDVRGGMADG